MKLPMFITLFALSATVHAAEPISSHMKDFALHQCFEKSCVHAVGELGYMSMAQDSLSASQVAVRVVSANGSEQKIKCDSFSYDLNTQLLVCDNTESSSESYTVDGKLVLRKFRF